MHIVYIDDSNHPPIYTFSAIVIEAERWRTVFNTIKTWRSELKKTDNIDVYREFHAVDFISGHGKLGPAIVVKWRRCEIFKAGLSLLANQEGVSLFNVCLNRQDWAFERLLNRINRTMQVWDSNAILICDQGKEAEYTALVRKMGVYNPIPSRYCVWPDGHQNRNIPIDRIIEDPFFKISTRSFLIQMADFCAYALLRREVQLASKNKYGLHKAFELLGPICFKDANQKDQFGIIR
ncbi:MAG: DUF3800 domain-containing protein [Gammaproteobacteria bacterium]|nr:DUF3800 domain-containing protein [Gammaproteobacteria bacterium]MDH3563541.1 DUF3800 domain-containing protein [Gammaproteobacteria bacterium]